MGKIFSSLMCHGKLSTKGTVILKRLATLMPSLVKLIELDYGLLELLANKSVLTNDEVVVVRAGRNIYEKNNRLLQYLGNKSSETCQTFLAALKENQQDHVAHFILHGDKKCRRHLEECVTCEADWPISVDQLLIITSNQHRLVQLLDVDETLLGLMESAGCLSTQQLQVLRCECVSSVRNNKAIEMLKRRSRGHLKQFAKCLEMTQPHLVPLLTGNHAIAVVHVQLGARSDQLLEVDDVYREIASRLKSARIADDATTVHGVDSALQKLGVTGRQFAAVRGSHGLEVHFVCESKAHLEELREHYASERLRDALVDVFSLVMKASVDIESVDWRTMSNDETSTTCTSVTSCGVDSIWLYEKASVLPAEMTEMILLKAAARLRNRLMETDVPMASRPANAAMLTTISGVCVEWWNILTCRDSNRRTIRRQFRHPFNLLGQLDSRSPELCGVAHLGDRIYVASSSSNAIRVFSDVRPFQQHADIVVPGMLPVDLTVCAQTGHLYATDKNAGAIWRIDPKRPESFAQLKPTADAPAPSTISARRGRLVVSPHGGRDSLFRYTEDGSRKNELGLSLRTRLPTFVYAKHAVERRRAGKYVVCHTQQSGCDVISELNSSASEGGQVVVRSYGGKRGSGPQQLSDTRHLALDSFDRVLAADYGNGRIVLLTADLKFDRVLLDKKSGQLADRPVRMFYSERERLLFVGLKNGTVNVYNWK